MSRGASKEQEQNKRFTSLRLIGGRDCNVNQTSRYSDLDVQGGGRIRKTLCCDGDFVAGGDGSISGNLTVLGNTSFDAIIVSNLIADLIDSNIGLIDNLTSVIITADSITSANVIGNLIGDLIGDLFGNICSDTRIKGDVAVDGNIVVGGSLYVSNIVGNSPVTIDDELYVQGNIFINGSQIIGPQQASISSISLDGILSNISPDGSLVAIANTMTGDESGNLNANYADLTEKINMILDVLVSHGLIA